jgi:type I restriction enzyme R subunit
VKLAIEDELGEGLPEPYTEEQYKAKCSVLFEHVYEAYQGDGASVFGDAAA